MRPLPPPLIFFPRHPLTNGLLATRKDFQTAKSKTSYELGIGFRDGVVQGPQIWDSFDMSPAGNDTSSGKPVSTLSFPDLPGIWRAMPIMHDGAWVIEYNTGTCISPLPSCRPNGSQSLTRVSAQVASCPLSTRMPSCSSRRRVSLLESIE